MINSIAVWGGGGGGGGGASGRLNVSLSESSHRGLILINMICYHFLYQTPTGIARSVL